MVVTSPLHADGTREGFDGDLSCHSAFLAGGLPYCSVCVSFNYFFSRFSWLHSQTVQRCGSGF